MTNIKIHPGVAQAIAEYKLPESLVFGRDSGPVMSRVTFKNGQWGELELLPFGPISIYPTAKVLHYAQEIFEGMKAYRVAGNGPFIFRPDQNLNRLNLSAVRMAMPEIPKDLFMTAINEVVSYSAGFVPRRTGESLYLRPFMIATDPSLGVRPGNEYDFYVVAQPSGSYFTGETHGISVLIEREDARAFPGGTGFAKTGGNYASSLRSAIKAKELGFIQTLWLDAVEKKNIEELSGMNVMVVINGELHTSTLGDTVLDGITRKSLIQLAHDQGIKVVERKINIDELIVDIKEGRCTEAFACGTAAIITPIGYFGEETGEKYPLRDADGNLSLKLREDLLAIQEGRAPDIHNWITSVEPKTL